MDITYVAERRRQKIGTILFYFCFVLVIKFCFKNSAASLDYIRSCIKRRNVRTQGKEVHEMRFCAQRSWNKSAVAYLQVGSNPRFGVGDAKEQRRI